MRSRQAVSGRLATLTVASMVAAAIVLAPGAAAGPPGVSPGDTPFWDGEYVAESRGGLPALADYFFAPPETQPAVDPCVTGLAFCRRYPFSVATGGATLRVALDSSRRGECTAPTSTMRRDGAVRCTDSPTHTSAGCSAARTGPTPPLRQGPARRP